MTDDREPVDVPERVNGYRALADDLDRWARTLRDTYSDMREPAIASDLERLAARCREEAEKPA